MVAGILFVSHNLHLRTHSYPHCSRFRVSTPTPALVMPRLSACASAAVLPYAEAYITTTVQTSAAATCSTVQALRAEMCQPQGLGVILLTSNPLRLKVLLIYKAVFVKPDTGDQILVC